MDNTQIGSDGESLACKYIEKLGYQILERNFRIRGGEIDIIALDGKELVFIEVKTRLTHEFGNPFEAITPWKIKFLLKAALFYIVKTNWGDKPYRLDAVGVDFTSGPTPKIELIKNITEF